MSFNIKITGLDKFTKGFTKAPQVFAAEISKGITKALVVLQGEARMLVPVDTGRLRNAITFNLENNYFGRLSANTDYAIFVHEGSRPHFPPLSAIEPWAKRHGAIPFAVALGISRKGTKKHPFFKLAKERKDNEVKRILNNMVHDSISKLK